MASQAAEAALMPRMLLRLNGLQPEIFRGGVGNHPTGREGFGGVCRENVQSRCYPLYPTHLALNVKCAAAPLFRSDIGDGFREIPAMAVKVLSVVLALAIGLILRFSQDEGSVLPGAFAVTFSIFNAT